MHIFYGITFDIKTSKRYIRKLENFIKKDDDAGRVSLKFYKANIAFLSGKTIIAEKYYRQIPQPDPDDTKSIIYRIIALFNLGNIYKFTDIEKGIKFIEQSLSVYNLFKSREMVAKNIDSNAIIVSLTEKYIAQDKYEKAFLYTNIIKDSNKKNSEINYKTARALLMRAEGRFDEMIKYSTELERYYKKAGLLNSYIREGIETAKGFFFQNRHKEALSKLRGLLFTVNHNEINNNLLPIKYYKVKILIDIGEYKKAEKLLEEITPLQKETGIIYSDEFEITAIITRMFLADTDDTELVKKQFRILKINIKRFKDNPYYLILYNFDLFKISNYMQNKTADEDLKKY